MKHDTWAPADKQLIGTAIAEQSRVWFTVAQGHITEVFYPTPDRACLRSLRLFVVRDGEIADESAWDHAYTRASEIVPLVTIENRGPAATITKEVIADPRADVVLQRVRSSTPIAGRVFCYLEPALDNCTDGIEAAVVELRGRKFLTAEAHGVALAVASSRPWRTAGAARRGPELALATLMPRAHGRVALVGELDLEDGEECILAVAFAHTPAQAAQAARGALLRGYDEIRNEFVAQWREWTQAVEQRPDRALWSRSIEVLKALDAKRVDGGRVAALSTPWGTARGPRLRGTYHVVWTRDLVQCVGGLLAAGVHHEARDTLLFLRATQHPDGHWPQNMLLDGERVWGKEEIDEAALPIILLDLARREGAIDEHDVERSWTMVERAAEHLMRTGPSTTLDRWEDTSGITPFTIASEIAALLCAADIAAARSDDARARRYRSTAERWNAQLDPLLYRHGGRLADEIGVAGYYVRARQPGVDFSHLRAGDPLPKTEISVDALALVRFGLRDANDPRIRDTVRVIDVVLSRDLPEGRAWCRYSGDEYGEHVDGAPFDGHGVGRPWPLLLGERAHYELARGDRAAAQALLEVMEACSNETGMLPEQVWDAPDLPNKRLWRGRPTGSAAPLGWAHAEYVKLCRSLADDRVFDMPTTRPGRLPW